MHITVEYTNEVETPFEKDFFQSIASKIFEFEQFVFLQGKDITLGVVIVSPEKIQSLNKQYRSHDSVTDVLSFGEYEGRTVFTQIEEQEIFLGDIFLCLDFIKTAATEDDVTLEREMTYIFSHGVLHLVGFDHEEEMFTLQESVTDYFTGKREDIKNKK